MMWYAKAAIIGGFVLVVGGAWFYDRSQQYEAGYIASSLESERASRVSLEKRISDSLLTLGVAIESSRKEAQEARKQVSGLTTTLDSVRITLDDINRYKEVDNQDECSRLGDMFLRLYNEPVKRFEW